MTRVLPDFRYNADTREQIVLRWRRILADKHSILIARCFALEALHNLSESTEREPGEEG